MIGRRFLSLIWVVAICFVIWFYGYLAAFGSFKPLASQSHRLIAIGLVVLAWLIYLGVSAYRSRKRDKELVEGIEQDAEALAEGERSAEVEAVRGQLRDALALLRRVTRRRLGYVYELPWYVIFGAPGSGKTTAVTNSGLTFPLGEASGSEGVDGVAGTRTCNWWFSEDAILVDTAGRYTIQDDLNGAAKAGWEGLLNLLKRYRRSQPVNGALIILSIQDLLGQDPDARRNEVRAIRKRLAEMDEFLKARVPVYLVLTKADLLTGFTEFFDGFNKSDREQVWGMTFDLAASNKASVLPEKFQEEFGLLQERVGAMLIERLQQEPDLEIRGRIFRFPAELSALEDGVHEILTELCSGSKLVVPPLLRGVYLASGTQTQKSARNLIAQPVPRMRRSYFLTRLFTDVIFGEAALVSRDRRLSRRQRVFRQLAYGGAVSLLVFVLASWTIAYFQNSSALAEANNKIAAYQSAIKGIPVTNVSDADFLRVLPALDELAGVTSGFDAIGVWPPSFGLDQQPKIASRQRDAYQRALNALLLPRMLVELQTIMDKSKDPNQIFDALKLYGMLGGLGPLDPGYVKTQSARLFKTLYPEEGRAMVRASLTRHATLMAEGDLPPLTLDTVLISKARSRIAGLTYPQRALALLREDAHAADVASWDAADALGPVGERAFERISGQNLQSGVPGLFTAVGYNQIVLPKLDEAVRTALNEGWVRGSPAATTSDTVDAVSKATLDLYDDAFTKNWTSLMKDIRVRQPQTIADETETARILASVPSPVEDLAKSVAAATDLRPPSVRLADAAGPSDDGAATDASEVDASAAGTLASAVTLGNTPDPYGDLRKALKPAGKGGLTDVADAASDAAGASSGKEKPSQIAALQPLLDAVYQQLSRASTSTAAIAQVFDADGQLTKSNQDLLQAARRLPEPVATWMVGLAADVNALSVKTARHTFAEAWQSEGASLCAAAVNDRYPFKRTSKEDIPLADFTQLFGPQGLFQSFFTKRLAPFVDTTKTPWTWRGAFGAKGQESQALTSFEEADAIRRAFFGSDSPTPTLSINVVPVSLSDAANAVMLEVDGERVVYYHGPKVSKSIQWPTKDAANQSLVAFQPGDRDQATTESGDWSPFRLLDSAKILSRQNDMMRAEFDVGGKSAVFDIQFGSVLNPFDLPALKTFQCPSSF
nr:type VI secretion system membrane subunit TssM [Jiella flava]